MSWRFQGNEMKYIREVLDTDFRIATLGGMCQRFEKLFAETFGVTYATASSSGTAALHQAMVACGVGQGDEVIVPPLTVLMCANAAIYAGAKPVFADVNRDTFLIDPADIERKITLQTKAILAVNLYGQVCDMRAIMAIARKNNIKVIEDCAQCYLGLDERGNIGGTIGDIGIFSLGETKMISSGEGGVLITNNISLAEKIRKFGTIGFKNVSPNSSAALSSPMQFQDPSYLRHDSIGVNYIMSEVASAMALAQTERIYWFLKKRRAMARMYLEAIGNCQWLAPQQIHNLDNPAYWTYAVVYEGQEKLGVSWYRFRDMFIKLGGDKVRAAWALIYNDPAMIHLDETGHYFVGDGQLGDHLKGFLDGNNDCPNAEYIQPKLMQFTTNQETETEMIAQAEALRKTIGYFGR